MTTVQPTRIDRGALRETVRHPVDVAVGCKVEYLGRRTWTKYTRGVVVDVSKGGLGVDLRLGLRPGARVKLELLVGDDALRLCGRVAWAMRPGQGRRMGIELHQWDRHLLSRLAFLGGQISGELSTEPQCEPLAY